MLAALSDLEALLAALPEVSGGSALAGLEALLSLLPDLGAGIASAEEMDM